MLSQPAPPLAPRTRKNTAMITTHALSILLLALTVAFLILLASHVSHDFALRRANARIDALEAACAAAPAAATE